MMYASMSWNLKDIEEFGLSNVFWYNIAKGAFKNPMEIILFFFIPPWMFFYVLDVEKIVNFRQPTHLLLSMWLLTAP